MLGIRQASLYYYFSSKEAALELVCLKGVEGFFEAAKTIAARPESARKRLISLIESHLSPLVDRADFVKVFLNERQHLPRESRRRIGRWSRGLERIFEDVIKEGVAKGEFRADLDVRLATLAILGMRKMTGEMVLAAILTTVALGILIRGLVVQIGRAHV